MRRKTVIWIVSLLAIVGLIVGLSFAYRAYRVHQVESEINRFAGWLKEDILEVNPVEVTGTMGEHDWTGAWYAVNVRTPTGAEFSIQVLISSSFRETKITKVWLHGPSIPDIQLSLDLVTRKPVDLKEYLPSAFQRPLRGD